MRCLCPRDILFGSEGITLLVTLIQSSSASKYIGLRGVQFRKRLSTNYTHLGELYIFK